MNSGSAVPTGSIVELQGTYDAVVSQVGCSSATDTLVCLRTVSTDSLLAAANNTPPPDTSYVVSVCRLVQWVFITHAVL